MALRIHSDASYLSAPKARSRVEGHFFLGNYETSSNADMHNGVILVIAKILRSVMSSAAEEEFGGLFVNTKEGDVIRTMLKKMGWEQKALTPIATDNSTASGIVNDTIRQCRSRAVDMRFYWVRNRVAQRHFIANWAPAKMNLGDYFTKHHTARHHRDVRPFYVKCENSPNHIPNVESKNLQGCVELYRETAHVLPDTTRSN